MINKVFGGGKCCKEVVYEFKRNRVMGCVCVCKGFLVDVFLVGGRCVWSRFKVFVGYVGFF